MVAVGEARGSVTVPVAGAGAANGAGGQWGRQPPESLEAQHREPYH